jgi:hypothetical protein
LLASKIVLALATGSRYKIFLFFLTKLARIFTS